MKMYYLVSFLKEKKSSCKNSTTYKNFTYKDFTIKFYKTKKIVI